MSTIANLEVCDRPREKALKNGFSSLSDKELLAIIIRCGVKGKSSIELSSDILDYFGSLHKLLNSDIYSLMNIKGIKKAKALELLAVIEIAKRVSRENYRHRSQIKGANDAYDLLKEELENQNQENFIVIFLNVKLNVIKKEVLFLGGESSSLVDINLILKKAITCGAKKIICAHNHPSGDSTPSMEDINLTKRIRKICEVVKIDLLDHIIIGKNNYFSFSKEGI